MVSGSVPALLIIFYYKLFHFQYAQKDLNLAGPPRVSNRLK